MAVARRREGPRARQRDKADAFVTENAPLTARVRVEGPRRGQVSTAVVGADARPNASAWVLDLDVHVE